MSFIIESPYSGEGSWLRGSFHIHSLFSACGRHDAYELALAYRYYDFMAVTDHDRLTDEILPGLENKAVFRGLEVSGERHMLLVEPPESLLNNYDNTFSVENYQRLSDGCLAAGGISVINHPARLFGQWWRQEELDAMEGATCMEIFSGDGIHVEEDTSFAQWDRQLTRGKQIWGIGNDDFHHWGQERRVWNVVQANSPTKAAILGAIRRGDFYVSSGYGFESISVEGSAIRYRLKSGNELFDRAYKYLTLFGAGGRVLAEKTGRFTEFSYIPSGDEGYVRAEVYMAGGYGGFSQPIWIREQ